MRIVFAGAGHATMVALARLRGLAGAELTLVSASNRAHYSGMVPGWIEGLYREDEMVVPLATFAHRLGVRHLLGTVVAADEDSIRLADGARVPFDVLVINTGSTPNPDLPSGEGRIVAAKPFEALVAALTDALDSAPAFAIAGAGVAGCEIALALAARRPDARVSLLERSQRLLPSLPAGVSRRIAQRFRRAGIDLRLGARIERIERDELFLTDGAVIAAPLVLAFTGASAPSWLEQTPFARAKDGFLAVDATLRSISHPNVIAVGDVATREDDPRPKSGVFAVRSGPPLARAVSAMAEGREPPPVKLQRHALVLLATGGRRAIGTRNGFVAEGRWVWRLKDRFDRRFVEGLRAA